MRRRRFLKQVVGLMAGVTVVAATAKTTVTDLPSAEPKMRLRQVIIDSGSVSQYLKSPEGEQVLINILKANRPILRQLT